MSIGVKTVASFCQTWLGFLALGGLLAAADLPTQTTQTAAIKNFKIPDYYSQTHRLKTLLVGAEAQFQVNRPIPIKGLRIETYSTDGKTNLIILATDCVYDNEQQTAFSPGALQVRSVDGDFFLEGHGFLWRQTNSILIVSNNVRTVIRRSLFEPVRKKPDSPQL